MKIGVLGTGTVGQHDRDEARRARSRGDDGLAHGRQRAGRRLGRRGGRRRGAGDVRRRGGVRRDRLQLHGGRRVARGSRLDRRRRPRREDRSSTSPTRSTSRRGCRRRSPSRNTDSLGEQIQRALPDARVVKTLNTVNAMRHGRPGRVPGEHDVFVCGNDADAKAQVIRAAGELRLAARAHRRPRRHRGARGRRRRTCSLWLRL